MAIRGLVVDDANIRERILPSGDEAGTPPGDRRFRPDVEGLRAVAVAAVVLFHAGVPGLSGGYVGVDVFFVISGFVITGVLLRERDAAGRTSILNFYARRVRRILPAATLVILSAAFLAFMLLGWAFGSQTAADGRWASVFLVNFHFIQLGTNYFTAQLPPSPVQNFWTLSVEEQFYVVYPTLIVVVALVARRIPFRVRLAVVLGCVIVASYAWSIIQTQNQPTAAYFSPLTRAWELALGGLVAIGATQLKRVPAVWATLATWAGLGAIVLAVVTFGASTEYPGAIVAIPVIGAALVIGGGVVEPRLGAERLIGTSLFRGLGKISYSLYLWHWPILIVAAERTGKTTLPLGESLLLVAVAVAISVATYFIIENPIRHSKLTARRSIIMGVLLVLGCLGILTASIVLVNDHDYPKYPIVSPGLAGVLHTVAAAPQITHLPRVLDPPLPQASEDRGNSDYAGCIPGFTDSDEPVQQPSCTIGDQSGHQTMVVLGDSHALMWLPAFDAAAKAAGRRLIILGKPGCAANIENYATDPGLGHADGVACDEWHTWALNYIKQVKPALVVVTQEVSAGLSHSFAYTPKQWQTGLSKLLDAVRADKVPVEVLGDIPMLPQAGNVCLGVHPQDVQACSGPPTSAITPFQVAEKQAAARSGVRYVSATPWFCSTVCTAVIGHFEVYADAAHITAAYAQYLSKVVTQAINAPLPAA